MSTRKSNDMRSSSPNITKRSSVFGSDTKRQLSLILGSEGFNKLTEEWPTELKKRFDTFLESYVISSEDDITVLTKFMNKESNSPYLIYIKDTVNALVYTPESAIHGRTSEKTIHLPSNEKTEPNSLISLKTIAVVGIILFTIGASYFYSLNNKESSVTLVKNEIQEWENSISELSKKFPSQNDDIWCSIQAGVKATVIEKPVQPSVFLLLHNDKRTSACLAQSVGKEAAKLLSKSSQEPVVIRGEELKMNKSLMQDYGLFLEAYQQEMVERHVMVILDLQEIPAKLAQSFHALCDVENPLVQDSAILFTMQIDGTEELKPTASAEKYLKLLWKDSLDVDIMDPLITRITNMVLSVKLETHNVGCS